MSLSSTSCLTDLQRMYDAGSISKPEFIHQANRIHKILWEYSEYIRNCEVRRITITADGVEFILGDEELSLQAPAKESRVAPLEIFNFGSYESVESRAMDILAAGGSCLLDVGANIGYHAIRLALRDPNCEVHAFEPMPVFHDFLQRNISLNNVGSRVRSYNYGLSSENGSFDFYISPENGTNASLRNVAQRSDADKVVGLTMRLDDWLSNYRIKPDFIKIDVEGAELLVLDGAVDCINSSKPKILAELLRKWSAPFGYHPNQVLDQMFSCGYGCWALSSQGATAVTNVADETVETNFVFLHHAKHRDTITTLESSNFSHPLGPSC